MNSTDSRCSGVAYRDPKTALELRREALSGRRTELVGERAHVEQELREVEAELDEVKRHRLPMLARVQVATPCNASWDDMQGDDRVRFCKTCEKNVYNLSAVSEDEAEALVYEHEGKLCARFYRRKDGTLLTSDCQVGKRRRRRIGLAALSLAAAAAGGAYYALLEPRATMGAIAVVPDNVAIPGPER